MSVVYDLMVAVKTRLETIASFPTVQLRKKPVVLESDTFPLAMVCFLQPETVGKEAMPNIVWWEYPLFVAYVKEGDREFAVTASSVLEVRESIRDKLYQPILSGVTSAPDAQAEDIKLDPGVPIDFGGRSEANFEVVSFVATYSVRETRDA